MAISSKDLASEFGARIKGLYDQGDPCGRKTLSRLLSKWSGQRVSEWTARQVREIIDLPANEPTGNPRLDILVKPNAADGTCLEDEQTGPMTRELTARGDRIKTLEDLLAAANVSPDWEVAHWKANAWEQAQKTSDGHAKIVTLHQVKASLVKKLESKHRPAQPVITVKHTRRPPRTDQTRRCLFIPDSQVGYRWRDRYKYLDPMHDRLAMDACVKLAAQGFDTIFLLGDMADLGEWQRKFPTEPSLKNTTQPTIDELHWWLAHLRAAAGEDCEIIYLAGNHEERVLKRLIVDVPEAVNLAVAGEEIGALHVAKLLRLAELNIKWVGPYGMDYWLWDRIRVTHGTTVRPSGGQTVGAVLRGASWSEVFGHIHRLEYAEKTLHSPEGPKTIACMSPGSLCRLDPGLVPGFKKRQDWQTGVGVAWLKEGDGHSEAFIQAIPIRKGGLIWADGYIQGEDQTEKIARDTGWSQFIGG